MGKAGRYRDMSRNGVRPVSANRPTRSDDGRSQPKGVNNMSIYDEIATAKDLIFEVKAHGLSTNVEDIVRIQDIFGNSATEELEALATDNGRRDTSGNPDQFGSLSSGNEGTQKIFYQIIFAIWSWEDATRYYNEHSNILYIEGRQAVKTCDVLNSEIARKDEIIATLNGVVAERKEAIKELTNEKVDYQKEIDEKDAEIIKLKAKLYDLMSN